MKITKLTESKTLWSVWENVEELLNPELSEEKVISHSYRLESFNEENHDEWRYGDFSVEESKDMVLKGYLNEKAEAQYQKILKKYGTTESKVVAPVARRRRRKNEYDGELCIDSYLAGQTDYYRRVTKVKTQNRIVRAVINLTYHAGTSAQDFMMYNMRAIQSIENMLKEGKMVEVYGAFTGRDTFYSELPNTISLLKLKEADRGIDMRRLKAASLPAFARFVMFRSPQLVAGVENYEVSGGLGQAIHTSQNASLLNQVIKEASEILNGEIVFFDGTTDRGLKGVSSKDLK